VPSWMAGEAGAYSFQASAKPPRNGRMAGTSDQVGFRVSLRAGSSGELAPSNGWWKISGCPSNSSDQARPRRSPFQAAYFPGTPSAQLPPGHRLFSAHTNSKSPTSAHSGLARMTKSSDHGRVKIFGSSIVI